jgi:hypothetical protein
MVLLARSVAAVGGEVWFLASPLAAKVAGLHFPGRVFQMTAYRNTNQIIFWRMVKKFRPDIILFSELYEILQPNRTPDCPFIDRWWLCAIAGLDCVLVFMDFIVHVPMLRAIAECETCVRRFGTRALRAFLQRLWVILPCPLNEPGPIVGRCGIPYRVQTLPLTLKPADRIRVRTRFLGNRGHQERYLVLRTGSSWQTQLAEQYGVFLYEFLGDLLAVYLGALPKPVTLVSVSSRHKISCRGSNLDVHNISNLAPHEFESLLLSSDLVITDNEIGYTLAKTLGRVPGLVLVNTYTLTDLLDRESKGSRVRNILLEMQRQQPDSIYPHKIFPIPAGLEELVEEKAWAKYHSDGAAPLPVSTFRLGRMRSSPFVKAELYGGQETRRVFKSLLCDSEAQANMKRIDSAFLKRVNELDDGATVLNRLNTHNSLAGHMVL